MFLRNKSFVNLCCNRQQRFLISKRNCKVVLSDCIIMNNNWKRTFRDAHTRIMGKCNAKTKGDDDDSKKLSFQKSIAASAHTFLPQFTYFSNYITNA